MSLRAVQSIVPAGTPPTFAAATASDTMEVGDGKTYFAVYRSTHSATVAVTAVTTGNLPTGDTYPDKTYNLAIGSTTMQEVWIPILRDFLDPATGHATITCTPVTNVTLAVVRR